MSEDKVGKMDKAQATQQSGQGKRKAVLSPELNEFLHMLKALESNFAGQTPQSH